MILVNSETNLPVSKGDTFTTNNGIDVELISWCASHKPSSTGRVYVRHTSGNWSQEFFPSVIGCKFIRGDSK